MQNICPSITNEDTRAHGVSITNSSNFCKSKIDDGWLGACPRMNEGNVTSNLNYLFPDVCENPYKFPYQHWKDFE